jgi:hypothetical protein
MLHTQIYSTNFGTGVSSSFGVHVVKSLSMGGEFNNVDVVCVIDAPNSGLAAWGEVD